MERERRVEIDVVCLQIDVVATPISFVEDLSLSSVSSVTRVCMCVCMCVCVCVCVRACIVTWQRRGG